jgi:hypothetical protein
VENPQNTQEMDFINLRDLLKSIPTDDSSVTEVLKHLEAVIIPSDRRTDADLQRFKTSPDWVESLPTKGKTKE